MPAKVFPSRKFFAVYNYTCNSTETEQKIKRAFIETKGLQCVVLSALTKIFSEKYMLHYQRFIVWLERSPCMGNATSLCNF